MTEQKARERFSILQAKAQQASEAARDCAIDLRVKYGDAYYRGYLGRREIHKLEMLQRAETRAVDRLFAFLDTIQGRQFRSDVPCHWIVEKLTYDDATTRGQMSMIPPPAYGRNAADSQQFALPMVRSRTLREERGPCVSTQSTTPHHG